MLREHFERFQHFERFDGGEALIAAGRMRVPGCAAIYAAKAGGWWGGVGSGSGSGA
ncbi:MAG TPA: hypothetical protein VFZ92_23785 [Umezawaea sp.]